jgi:hypothetical protein
LDAIYERCCGLDVHKRTIAACLIVPGMGGAPQKEIRTFGTMTEDLLELTDWLAAAGCASICERRQNERCRAVQSLRVFEQAFDHCRHKAIAKTSSHFFTCYAGAYISVSAVRY